MLVSFIAEGLGHRRGLRTMQERAARANIDAALSILDKAPDVPPDGGDEIEQTQEQGPSMGRQRISRGQVATWRNRQNRHVSS